MKKFFLTLLTVLLMTSQGWTAPLLGGDSDLPVDVTSDNMEYDSDNNTVIFRGNVEVVRGGFKMWSDILTLVLRDQGDEKRKTSSAKNSSGDIDRIIAEKNVRFRNDTQHGTAQKATFFAKQNVLVLDGNPVIYDGDNSIRGSVIRYFINENRSVVEGSSKKRVHAVFSSEKKGK